MKPSLILVNETQQLEMPNREKGQRGCWGRSVLTHFRQALFHRVSTVRVDWRLKVTTQLLSNWA